MLITCPTAERLNAYLRGEDSHPEDIEAHVAECDKCNDRMDMAANSLGLLDGLIGGNWESSDAPAYDTLHQRLLNVPVAFEGRAPQEWLATEPTSEDATESLPRTIGGYELIEVIGRGATGTVYRARHLKLSRIVAIKIIQPGLAIRAEDVRRLQHEMKAAGRLEHRHIVRATDAGEENGTHFLVMEYAEGWDLATALRRLGPFPVPEACETVRQASEALAAVHDLGMVHRDVKLSNLLMTASGIVKLLDLGLVALHESEELEEDARPRGTPEYMSPEHWTHFHNVDIRSDLYSLGCAFYKLLTGQSPQPDSPGADRPPKRSGPKDPRELRPDLPRNVARIVTRLLEPKPEDRYQSPAELSRALAPLCRRAEMRKLIGPLFPDAPREATHRDSEPRRWRWLTVGTVSLCLLAGLFIGSFWPKAHERLNSSLWRPLHVAPTMSLPSDRGAVTGQSLSNVEELQLTSNAKSLLHLGIPLSPDFSLRFQIRQETPRGKAGLFFGFHESVGNLPITPQFHAIEWETCREDSARHKLVWSYYGIATDETESNFDRTIIAHLYVRIADDQVQSMLVRFSERGFPRVTWNGQAFDARAWDFARGIAERHPDIRHVTLGRIGLINDGGTTWFVQPSLQYHRPQAMKRFDP